MNIDDGKRLILRKKQKKNFYFSKIFFRFLEILFIIIGLFIIVIQRENTTLSYKLNQWEEKGGFLLKQSFSLPEKKFVAEIPALVEKLSRMVYIPAGNFTMGSTEQEDTSPVRTVYVDSFYISRYEVTNKEYEKFIQATGYSVPYQTGKESELFTWNPLKRTYPEGWDNMPVVLVNWQDAMEYCKWLSKEWHCTISLPTEAQWEKAARGMQEFRFPWGQTLPQSGWSNIAFNSPALASTGSYEKDVSPFGCFDMAGNVSEWCRDSYQREAYKKASLHNPYIVEESIWGVVRGGNWTVPSPSLVTTTYRQAVPKTSKNIRFGFRYVLELK
jgi:formylglycine-generating enzyme required for sulfatase activity